MQLTCTAVKMVHTSNFDLIIGFTHSRSASKLSNVMLQVKKVHMMYYDGRILQVRCSSLYYLRHKHRLAKNA